MSKIKTACAGLSAWLDQSVDNRGCAALLAFALGFALTWALL